MQDTDLPWLEVSATQLKVLSVDLLKASVKTRVWSLSLGKLGLVDITAVSNCTWHPKIYARLAICDDVP